MNGIRVGCLTILSAAMAMLAICFSDADVELRSLEIGVSVSETATTLTIDPVFALWMDDSPWTQTLLSGAVARAVGGMIFIRQGYRHDPDIGIVLRHEENHVAQQRGLGLATPLGYLLLNMEGEPHYTNAIMSGSADEFATGLGVQWVPPRAWPSVWHTLLVRI